MKFPKNLASVEKLMFLIIVFIAFFAVITVSAACNCPDFYKDSELEIGTANPAAVYCNELGYEYKIITDSEGGQRGVCIFPDNTSCGAWEFFTGKCGQNYSYCGLHGCDIKTMSDGKNPYSPEYAVCILPNETTKPVTKLMDLDEKISVGAIPIEYKSKNVSESTRENKYVGAVNPTTFDWRNKDGENWITRVKDQGSCGSCWAFAAVGGVESKINIARNDSDFDVNLAEQYLVSDCCEDCGGCNGGSSTSALGFIKTQGISDEPCFPYIASDCPCSYRCVAWDKRLWKIDDYDYVASGRENMKSYLIEKGPLVVTMCMNGQFDANGIYRCDGPPGSYHAVVIVGYNNVEGCWIAKNSWGSGWNEDGYFKVGYGECRIEDYPRYIDLTKEHTEDFKADDIKVYTGSRSGTLNDTYYKDGNYIILSEKCYTISCDGLDARINLSVETLQNITSMDLIVYQRARWEGGFSLYYWDENSNQWISLGGIPDSTWHLMKYKLCDSESECASYLSSGTVSVKYYHPSCSFCNTDYVDIDWLYLEAYPGKTYCPASTNNADYEWINRVALNTGERISGNSTYSDFTDEVLTTLNRGDTYTLQVDGHTTGGYKEFVKAWIDFNNDKDFIDAGEAIDLGNYTFNGNHTFSAQFKVPDDSFLSDTRMRVYLKYGGEPSPCENSSYGEVEDYKIKISSAAVLTDNYYDYGIDIDEPPNGYYDYLAIDVGVNVTELGYYWIGGDLFDEVGSYVDSAWNSTHLDSGNHSVTLKFSGIDIRKNGVNGTFNLKHLSIRDDSYDELDYRYDAYTTYYYNYTDFEPLPALFASGFNDYGEDTNSNALYDYLVIEKEINVLKAGDYRASGWLYAPNGTSVDYDSNYTTLSAGLHNVTLKFRGWDIYKTGENGNFDVSMYLYYYPPESAAQATTVPEKITVDSQYIPIQESIEEKEIAFEIYEEGLENKTLEETGLGSSLLDWMENTTSYYSHTEFESPPAEFNDQNSDFGEDTDGDGLYNYLVVGVGVNVTEAGDYRARGYLYDNTGHQIDYESNTTYLNVGNQTVQLKFEGIKIRQNEVNGTFDLSLYLYDSATGDTLDYRYYTTSYYSYTEFQIPPAEFNDVYSDYGEDTDGDGLYDYLVVDVGVNVTEAGDYRISGELYENGTYNYVNYASNTTYLSEGNQTVKLRFDAWKITKSGTFDLKYLGLYNATTFEQLDYRYYAYTTGYYEPLPRPALFNDVYSNYGENTTIEDNLYDYLVINVGVNVTEAGDYRVRGELYENGTYNSIDYAYNTTYLTTGNQTVQLRFEGIKIRQDEYNGTYDLKYLYLYNSHQFDYRYYAYTTSYYNWTEFQIPPAEFNDIYSDYGEDTNGDGLYDYLVVDVGVNVTEAGDYRVRGYLYENGTYDSVDYDSNTTYLNEGNQTVQLRFEGIKIRQNEYNGTYDLKSLYLYNYSSPVPPPTPTPPPISVFGSQHESKSTEAENFSVGYGEQLDYRYYAYTTPYYHYTIFQIPPAEFNDVYEDYGEDTDGDGLYDYLVIEVGINVIEAGDYRVSGKLYENGTYDSVDYDSNTSYLEAGNQTVKLRFDAWKITKSGTFDLKYLGLYNATYPYPTPTPVPTATPTPAIPRGSKSKAPESVPVGYGEQLDYRYYAYTTGYYEPLPRPALLNDVYSDEGEDTNDPQDGLYNYLVVEVGVNVIGVGNYRISGELYETGTYNFVDSTSNTVYLNHPGNQTVPLRFEGIKIRNNEYNGTYDLKYLSLYDANYPVPTPTPTPAVPRESKSKPTEGIPVGYGEQLDYRYYAYTTSYYNYTEFEESIPDAYEPDDNYSMASYISVEGTKQIHDFHVPGDHDWLKFNATKDSSYTIETSELGDESDTYMYLYDTNGTTEIKHDDDGGIGLASKIIWNCSISGTYYIMARHYSSSACGPETRYNISVIVKEAIFDTGSSSNPYPSIMGNHTGTIKPNHTVIATKLYTYPCIGTGGHTEYAEIRNATWNATATWEGYIGDWYNITFDKTVVLLANETYNYTIHTGSYPQIIHETPFNATGGTITCDKFIDANGRVYYDWIPAIKFFC